MNFNNLNLKLETEDLTLTPVSADDRVFINEIFSDNDIKRNYIVPKEAQQDYRKLIEYWRNDVRNGAGNCWIIYEKRTGLFTRRKKVGFIAFEFRGSLKNARISYAILSDYRGKGIAGRSAKLVIERLKKEGVERIEADIDMENLNSEKVVEKLGFSANKKHALIDPEMIRDGEVRMRALWIKELYDYSQIDFYPIKEEVFKQFINNRTIYKIWEEEVSSDPSLDFLMPSHRLKKTGRYHFSLVTDITEKLVGISDEQTIYKITWELLREEKHGEKEFLILGGWGDPMSTNTVMGLSQFENYEIGVEKRLFANLISKLMLEDPNFFSIDKMSNTIGLDGFKFGIDGVRM